MRLKTPALLTGPYDWDSALLPVHEFETRLRSVRQVLSDREVSALIVHGNSAEYGALAYLANFAPKLGPAFALVAPHSPIRLLASGSPTMLSAAKRLTWVEDVHPVGDLKSSVAAWLADFPAVEKRNIGLWGRSKMALRPYHAIKAAIQPFGQIADLAGVLESLRLRKSAVELNLCRQSCRILQESIAAMTRAFHSGSGTRSVALAAEQSAYRCGAQDVRVYVSARPGSPPVFIDTLDDPVIEPLLAYLAVRFAGYWAEEFVTLTKSNSPALSRARTGLAAMLKSIRAGITFEELTAIAEENVAPYKLHSLAKLSVGNSIGLSIEEPCEPAAERHNTIQPGGLYTLRCGAIAEGADSAIASAMVFVGEKQTDILWSALDNPATKSP